MDPDEFVARMVAAGVPDMELSAPPGDQSDAALAASLLDDDVGSADQTRLTAASSPKSSMAQAQPLIDPSTGHLVAPHAAPPGEAAPCSLEHHTTEKFIKRFADWLQRQHRILKHRAASSVAIWCCVKHQHPLSDAEVWPAVVIMPITAQWQVWPSLSNAAAAAKAVRQVSSAKDVHLLSC